ncbi:MAG: hypothetical protein A2Z99_13475 [Treponema sp. GWB1_62_6]|nr:MAG: hypothetical protein A2Y36_18540 [Treponema sp. GWA1_62_8]OHE67609.1 MAG: hypothetical protein A2001_19655 [Treponema sp. GWC1_61_84]OHE70019.1 MAG: hypothetical protein A2Z99_13475 [Treponema sp. GWB1_62_6]OHE70523.1 MAG: hypothetical protein A2413_19315 [Treponema sp. RIFOXYC1_FULL_61_9]HCM25844.1 hypothetical protein [Treponema sp.]
MDTQTIKLLAEYNATANGSMNAFFTTLSDEQWKKEFRGFFNSLKSMCNHVYIGDFNWLKRFSGLRKFGFIENPIFERNIKFDETVADSVKDFIAMRNALDSRISRFADEVKTEDLDKDLIYLDSHGNEYRRNFGGLILHMFNHETHHRGMISLYLEELGIANDYSNLAAIL